MSLLFAAFLTLQASANIPLPPPPDQSRIVVRPGDAPGGRGPGQASEIAEPIGLAVAAFDTNHDGLTSRAEMEAALVATFTAADTNGDGALGYIEYSNWATTWLGSATALPGPYQIDINGDDRLSRDEFMEAFRRSFAALDRNGDGSISHAELLTVRNPVRAPLPERRDQPRPRQRQ